MLDRLTYKQKNKLLLILAIILLYIIYNFGVKKTLLAYKSYAEAESKIALAKNATEMAVGLEEQLLRIDSQIGHQDISNDNIKQQLLQIVTDYCREHKAILREFPKTTINQQSDLFIETNHFVVEGNFKTLLELVYLLEQKNQIGKVASVNYQYKKNPITRKMSLTASIYLQNVTNQNYEN